MSEGVPVGRLTHRTEFYEIFNGMVVRVVGAVSAERAKVRVEKLVCDQQGCRLLFISHISMEGKPKVELCYE